MEDFALLAVSPVDGRYYHQTRKLDAFFSEHALLKYRILVEVEYFKALAKAEIPQLLKLPDAYMAFLDTIYNNFTLSESRKIKEIERTTNHDVKAVEYYIRNCFDTGGYSDFKEFIHFGLTSQDINNTAIPLLLKDYLHTIYLPGMRELSNHIRQLALQAKDIPMLAYTHGQPASPTRLGKEFMVFAERLEKQLLQLEKLPHTAKFGGATGNFNAHFVAYPQIDWLVFADNFIRDLGLKRQQFTTQIDQYDDLAAILDNIKRINTILTDLSRDCWLYISHNYFSQRLKEGEVGSSAMPHKVNPIDFENAEGNLGMANALFEFIAAKLPVSRLQRDLTDSTVLRNIGVPFAHSLIAVNSLIKGLSKLRINQKNIHEDLDNNWAVIAEAIQTILRRENYPHPYEVLKGLTRGNSKITRESLHDFIQSLAIDDRVKEELKSISPFNYTGKSPDFVA